MEGVIQSTPGDSSKADLLEMSQIFIRQLKESKDREIKLQEKIRALEKQQDIQNDTTVSNQQQHGVQELRQQIVELTQQFRQLKSVSDEKVQRLSNEVAKLETEAKDKDAKIKDMTGLENAHQSTIGSIRMEKDELQKRLDEANAQLERMRVELQAHDQELANRNDQENDRLNAESAAILELKARWESINEENERLKQKLDQSKYRLEDTQTALRKVEDEKEEQQAIIGTLQDEMVALKERKRQAEESQKTGATALESARKKVKDLEAKLLTAKTSLNERDKEITKLKGDANKSSQGSGKTSSSMSAGASAAGQGQSADKHQANGSDHKSSGSSQRPSKSSLIDRMKNLLE